MPPSALSFSPRVGLERHLCSGQGSCRISDPTKNLKCSTSTSGKSARWRQSKKKSEELFPDNLARKDCSRVSRASRLSPRRGLSLFWTNLKKWVDILQTCRLCGTNLRRWPTVSAVQPR